jgi:protein-S-isoprenylcysteine O-methyltransferase Ste14
VRFLIAVLISLANSIGLVGGSGSSPSFWSDPYRLLVGAVLVLAPIAIAAVGTKQGAVETRQVTKQRAVTLAILGVVLPLSYAAVTYFDAHHLFALPDLRWLRTIGLLVFGLGWALMFAGIVTLGQQYSVFLTVQLRHKIIRGGIYSRMRHPIYLGFIIWALGFTLSFRSWGGLIIWLVGVAGVDRKLRLEENFLLDRFPDVYRAYMQSTWRLVPYVY